MWILTERQAERRKTLLVSLILTLAVSIVGIVAAHIPTAAAAEGGKRLLLEVTLQSPTPDTHEIKITMTNTSSEIITIYDTDLPWITPNQLVFVKRAYRMDPRRTLLAKFTPMEDYARIPNEIGPGQSLQDTIDLNTLFPSLNDDTRKSDVTIEWICRSKRLEFHCREGRGGKLTIKRQSSAIESPLVTVPPVR